MPMIKNQLLSLTFRTLALIAVTTILTTATVSAQFAPSYIPGVMDFSGDGKAEATLYDPESAIWFTFDFATNTPGHASFSKGKQAVPGDYDGDGRTDLALCFDDEHGQKIWVVLTSLTSSLQYAQWGLEGDVPVPGDYDGDGRTDLAVYRQGAWHIQPSGGAKVQTMHFGLEMDRPVPADYDGDGRMDIAVFRPDNSMFYALHSSSASALTYREWTSPVRSEDFTMAADYDGDGKAEFASYELRTGVWTILDTATDSPRSVKFGAGVYDSGFGIDPDITEILDKPMTADYDGDGRADLAVYNLETRVVHVHGSSNGYFYSKPMGTRSTVPVSLSLIGQ